MKKVLATLALMFVLALVIGFNSVSLKAQILIPPPTSGAKVDATLEAYLAARLGGTAPVVITYSKKPGAAELDRLRSAGIKKGFALRELPMIIADMNLTQLASIRKQPGVRSIWGNRVMKPLTNESRRFIGVPQMMADREVITRNASNPGFPITGRGIGIGYIDTGIDATVEDLKYGTKVRQNVIQPLALGVISDGGLLLGVGISISDLIASTGFVPPIYIENAPTSDLESGHGTHGAGVAAGTGAHSGGFYGGVAVGAHLVGVAAGDDKGLPLVAIISAFDYLIVNQFAHNIRVINNSWGSSLSPDEIHPDNPINVATRRAHDLNITVVFAAGNAGDVENAINPYSTMPWTISVAAGLKNGFGTPADFTSRGVDNGTGADTAGMPADPATLPNLRPDVTAPGVSITSTRAHAPTPLMSAIGILNNDLQNVPPAFLPFYYSSDGTSFACPHISGVVALLLEADSTLTPDEVVTILRETATPMPYEERVVGAGYVDVHNAVRRALGLTAVPHPANLFPPDEGGAGGTEIIDPAGDQTGTAAQDITSCDFDYDATTRQLVYTLAVADMSQQTQNAQWTIQSNFGSVAVFVSAAVTETGAASFEYGTITTLPNGTPNQSSIGPTDSGVIEGNKIIMKLSIDKVSAAVGSDVVGTVSKATSARAQILIGTSVTGGLLLNADSASGRDFTVEDNNSDDPEEGGEEPQITDFTERLIGTLATGQSSIDVPVTISLSSLDAMINYHPANQSIKLELVDSNGNVVAVGDKSSEKRMTTSGLAVGTYKYRVSGSPTKNVDFVIKSSQLRGN